MPRQIVSKEGGRRNTEDVACKTHWRSRNILAREEHSRFEAQLMNFLKNAAVGGCLLFFLSPSFISLRFSDQQITYGPTIEAGAKGDHNV
jgi:hypothetical protein